MWNSEQTYKQNIWTQEHKVHKGDKSMKIQYSYYGEEMIKYRFKADSNNEECI